MKVGEKCRLMEGDVTSLQEEILALSKFKHLAEANRELQVKLELAEEMTKKLESLVVGKDGEAPKCALVPLRQAYEGEGAASMYEQGFGLDGKPLGNVFDDAFMYEPVKLCETDEERREVLEKLFAAFDNDGSGSLETDELFFLRRNTHAAVGAWSEGGKNHALMKNLDADGDGEVDLEEFVNYFNGQLPSNPQSFQKDIEEFIEAAIEARELQRGEEQAEMESQARAVIAAGGGGDKSLLEQGLGLDGEPLSNVFDTSFMYEPVPLCTTSLQRREVLAKLFNAFDSDGSGTLETEELTFLKPNSERKTGADWGEVMRMLDADGDGEVDLDEFVNYFDEALSPLNHPKGFQDDVAEFVEAAKASREAQRKKEHGKAEEVARTILERNQALMMEAIERGEGGDAGMGTLQLIIEELEKKLTRLRVENSNLKEVNPNSHVVMTTLVNEEQKLMLEKTKDLEMELKMVKQERDVVLNEIETLKKEVEFEKEEAERRLRVDGTKKRKEMEAKLESMSTTVQYWKKLASTGGDGEAGETALREKMSEIEKLKGLLVDREEAMTHLTEENDKVLSQKEEAIAETANELSQLKQQQDEVLSPAEVRSLREECMEKESENLKLKEEILSYMEEVLRQKERISTVQLDGEKHLHKQELEFTKVRQEGERVRQEGERAQESLDAERKERASQEKKLIKSEAALKETSINRKEMEKMRENLEESVTEIEKLNKAYKKLEGIAKDKFSTAEEFANLTSAEEKRRLDEEASKIEKEQNRLKQEIKELKEEEIEMQKRLQEKNEEATELSAEVQVLTAKKQSLQDERDQLKGTIT